MLAPETEIFVFIEGAEAVRHVVRPGEYVLGRAADADLRVEAGRVSARHARLTIQADRALIEDLHSECGTFVNGQPVSDSVRLWPGQRIGIGGATVELRRRTVEPEPDGTLPPTAAALHRLLPEAMRAERKYEIGGVVAQGGMGAILSAREAAIRREIAMKVMLESGGEADLLRFIEEAQITGQLEHPNIVPIHELGVDEDGQPFYPMKMVRGITLKKVLDLLAAGTSETVAKYPLAALLTLFQKVCDAVAFAHSRGVIHRDLKPENIMLGGYGEVLVMDWGLAKVLGKDDGGRMKDEEDGPAADRCAPSAKPLATSSFILPPSSFSTLAGTILGTPQYMSPEQAHGEVETLDVRTDIYALGGILFHLLELRPPVSGATVGEVLEKVRRGAVECRQPAAAVRGAQPAARGGPPPQAAEPAAAAGFRSPQSLLAVARRAMALPREERYASVPELQAEIAAYQAGFATAAEHAGPWKQFTLFVRRNRAVATSVAAALVLLGLLGAIYTVHIRRERDRAEREKRRAEAGERRAEDSLGLANAHLLRVKIGKARAAFDAGQGDEGLAWLAAVLRQDPASTFAPAWLLSALSDRNFPLPSAPPIVAPRTNESGKEDISALRFSPDGRRLLLGGRGSGVTLWDAATSAQLGEPFSKSDNRDALFIPDGRRIAWFGQNSKGVRLAEAESGKRIGDTVPGLPLKRIALSPDGALLATADERREVQLWDTRTLQQIGEPLPVLPDLPFFGSTTEITALEISPDNRWLVARAETKAQVWDLRSRQPLEPPLFNVSGSPTFHSSGLLLIPRMRVGGTPVSSVDRWRVLDPATGRAVDGQQSAGSATVYAAFSPDGSRLATGAEDSRARLWDARTGDPLTGWLRHGGGVQTPQFSPEGLRVLTVSRYYSCRLWDARSGELLGEPWHLAGAPLEVNQVRFSPDGAHVAMAALRGRMAQVWDVREGRQLPLTLRFGGSPNALAFSPDGQRLAVAVGSEAGHSAKVFEVAAQASAFPALPHEKAVESVAYSPDGRVLVTTSWDGVVKRWDAASGQPTGEPLRLEAVHWAAFSPDGQLIAGGGNKLVQLWNAATGQPAGDAIPVASNVTRVVFSPEGSLLAAATDFGGALIDVRAGKVRAEIAREQKAYDVRFNPDGTRLAVATERDGALVFDVATGEPACPPLPHANQVKIVRFTPDGARLLSASTDGTARVWDARTGAPLTEPIRHGDAIRLGELSPDGGRFATAGQDGSVRLWDARSGHPLSEPLRTEKEVRALAFTPDGRRLAVAISERVLLWDVPPAPAPAPPWLPALAEAVAGMRIGADGSVVPTAAAEFWSLRERLLSNLDASEYGRWAAWFLADRATRTASPWTEAKLGEELARLATYKKGECQEQILRYQPGHVAIMRELGNAGVNDLRKTPAQVRDGEYLLALAALRPLFESEMEAQRFAGNEAYTRRAGPRGFPARDPAATARQLDLTASYNMILEAAVFGGNRDFHLAMLPKGVPTFDGVRWDVRGLIAVFGAKLPPTRPYPERVDGLGVGQRAKTLRVLHGCGWSLPRGTKIGRYVLHYADGQTAELPIIYGEDVRNWGRDSGDNSVSKARPAWTAPSGDLTLHLSHRAYENPRPDAEIATLDFVSEKTDAAPFVVAITVE